MAEYRQAAIQWPSLGPKSLPNRPEKPRNPGVQGRSRFDAPRTPERVVEQAVSSELVSRRIPCLTGKKQGIFAELGSFWHRIHH